MRRLIKFCVRIMNRHKFDGDFNPQSSLEVFFSFKLQGLQYPVFVIKKFVTNFLLWSHAAGICDITKSIGVIPQNSTVWCYKIEPFYKGGGPGVFLYCVACCFLRRGVSYRVLPRSLFACFPHSILALWSSRFEKRDMSMMTWWLTR